MRALLTIAVIVFVAGGAVAIARFVMAGRVTRPMMDADSPGRRTNDNLPAAKPDVTNTAPPASSNVAPPIGAPMVKAAVRNVLPMIAK